MNSSRERNQPDYLLNRPAAVNTKHRRTQSNMTTLKAPMSVLQQQSVQRSDLNGHIRIGLQDSKGLLGVSKTQDERGTVPVAPSYPEMETYSAKRLKTLGLLQTSLQTNLTRFISLIEESRSSYARKSTNSLKSQILRIIGDLSSYGYGDNRKAAELIRSLEELFYEHQSKTDALISTKDSNYQFITNEANTFAQITLKISNELNLQIGSLKRKLGIFFQSLQHDDIEDHSIRQTIPAEGLQTNFSEAKPKQRVTMPTSMYMSAPNGKHDQGRQVLLTTDHQFHNSSDDKEGNPSLATSHKFFGSNGSDRIDYASPFKDHTGSDYSHKEVMSRLQHKFKSLEDDLLERWKTSQDRVSELEGRTRRLWDKVQEKDQEKLMLTESVATKSEEILNLTRQNTLLHLQIKDLKTQAEIMQNKLKIQDVFINNQNESMVQSSKAACESKQLWMKEKLECESLRVQCETLKVDLQQAKAAISPLQTMISGLQNALQQSEKKAQAQEIETQRLEVALKEETSKLAEETKAVESLQEKTKVLDVCSASLATLKQELEQKCSKVESLETALVQALKQREIEAKTLPQTPANAETAIEAPRPPIVEAPTVPTKIVTASAPHDQGDASEHLAKIDLLEKQIKELKDQFNTKENDLYQRIKELQSKLQDEKTRAEHFKFDFEETKEKLLTANVTISEYRNSKSALQSQLTDVIAERNLTNKIVVEKDTLIFQLKMHFAILADLLRKNGIRKNPDSDEPEKLSDGELVDVIERYIEQRLKYWLIINL